MTATGWTALVLEAIAYDRATKRGRGMIERTREHVSKAAVMRYVIVFSPIG